MPRLNALPGVRAAGTTSVIPFGGGWSTASFTIEGLIVPPGQNGPWGDIRIVTPRFFEAMRIPLKQGPRVHRPGPRRRAAGRRSSMSNS